MELITNERPAVGNCSVVPNNGTALETEFNIFCDDWSDPDMPLNYRFAQRLKTSDSWTWIYSGGLLKTLFIHCSSGIIDIIRPNLFVCLHQQYDT